VSSLCARRAAWSQPPRPPSPPLARSTRPYPRAFVADAPAVRHPPTAIAIPGDRRVVFDLPVIAAANVEGCGDAAPLALEFPRAPIAELAVDADLEPVVATDRHPLLATTSPPRRSRRAVIAVSAALVLGSMLGLATSPRVDEPPPPSPAAVELTERAAGQSLFVRVLVSSRRAAPAP
jgi:hypothetical protein